MTGNVQGSDQAEGAQERPRRTLARVAAELADVERHLHDVPPHSGGGRHELEVRRAALQRELRELRSSRS